MKGKMCPWRERCACFWQLVGGTPRGNPKMKGNENRKSQNERNKSRKGQNERKWRPKRAKWKEMAALKAQIKGNESQNERKWRPKRPKWKEMKAQKAKMKGNEGPKGQNERKWRPKRPKWKEMKAKHCKMLPGLPLIKFVQIWLGNGPFLTTCGKRPHVAAPISKKCRNEGPKGQNERKWKPKRPKWKEMKAQKTKMKGNKSRKGQNDNFWRQFFGWICLLEVTILERLGWQIWTRRAFWPKWKEMKARKAKMKGNEGPQSQNVKDEARKGQNEGPKAKMKGNEAPKGENKRKWSPKRP